MMGSVGRASERVRWDVWCVVTMLVECGGGWKVVVGLVAPSVGELGVDVVDVVGVDVVCECKVNVGGGGVAGMVVGVAGAAGKLGGIGRRLEVLQIKTTVAWVVRLGWVLALFRSGSGHRTGEIGNDSRGLRSWA
jgi:hypothetical protein